MKRKGPVLIVLIVIAILFASRRAGENKTSNNAGIINKLNRSLVEVDKNFYKVSTLRGLGNAFIDFADDSVIVMRNKEFPIIGKKELAKYYLNHEGDIKPLYWEPVKAEVSPDGQLGYTFGKWEYRDVDKNGKKNTGYGNYLTVWKRQKDNSWKYVYDGGGSTPGPWVK